MENAYAMSLFLLSPVTAGQRLLISQGDTVLTGVAKLLGGGLLLLGLGSGRDARRSALKNRGVFNENDARGDHLRVNGTLDVIGSLLYVALNHCQR